MARIPPILGNGAEALPIADVAAAAGWKDTGTLLTCYTQPTNDVMLTVMNEPTKVRDTAVSGRNGP